MSATSGIMKRVGELACQKSSYLKAIQAKVLSCEPTNDKTSTFDVVLSDSILFPEGGGQPCDLGTVGGAAVLSVQRRGDTCVIVTSAPLTVGDDVDVNVDWDRRLDHMQHHSAQHVITAMIERQLGLPTLSWALSSPTCYIQVPAAKLEESDVRRVEDMCNDLIAQRVRVDCVTYANREELPPARSRGIPADVTGPIRLIDIDNLDTCTCCGTHVENLSELQLIKLLHQEPKANTCRLHFVAGRRAVKLFDNLWELTRSVVKELGTNQETIIPAIKRRSVEFAAANKQVKRLMGELAPAVARQAVTDAASLIKPDQIFFYFHEDVDVDFLAVVGEAIRKEHPDRVACLGCGVGDGQFMVIGPTHRLHDAAQSISASLEGKGGISKSGFRGKGNMKKWKAMVKAHSVAKGDCGGVMV